MSAEPMILVVDDSVVTRHLLKHVLTANGHSVVAATNGLDALECLAELEYDLVVSDLDMPEMDGIALLKHLRATDRYRTLPVIMLTASGMDEDQAIASAEGASGFLTKPFSSWELAETVNEALESAREVAKP